MNIDSYINENRENILADLKKIVSYKSVAIETGGKEPFGKINAQCLNETLNIAERYGLSTKNLENYCGYAEIGSGKQVIGIATHLDVVPAGDDWKTDPFRMTIKDGKIYGRGVNDDKGAVIAVIYALKYIKELNNPLNKRVRLIMGCGEEIGSGDMKYYVEKEGDFDIGFTPDADFPCINGEKGRVLAIFKSNNTSIIDIKGGTVENAVCDKCVIKVKKESYDKNKLFAYFENNRIQFNLKEEENIDVIEVKGIAAHASKPELGKNAIMYLMTGLKEAGYVDKFVDYYCERFNFKDDGEGLNIKCSDEHGNLTCVNGTIQMKDGNIFGTIDIRVPVTIDSKDTAYKLENLKDERAIIEIEKCSDSIYFPLDSDIVTKLLKAYQDVTGDKNNMPLVIGGGTYAKELKNCIAFGCAFPEKNNKIHEANEYVDIEDLMKQIKIYSYAILELLKD